MGVFLGGHHHHLHAVAAGLPDDAVGQLRKKRVGQVCYHQANCGGMADAEFTGGGAGPVPEFINDPQHRFALGRRDRA
ncbi:hypothetical protein D9M72_494530 [compost metagenome]